MAKEPVFRPSAFYSDFERYMKRVYDNWNEDKIQDPVAAICQSFGHGKTRFIKEFAKSNYCCYLSLKKSTESSKSKFVKEFLESLKTDEMALQYVLNLLNSAIELMKNMSQTSNKYEEIFNNLNWSLHELGSENIDQYSVSDSANLDLREQAKLVRARQKAFKQKFIAALGDDEPLFIVIDDAEILLTEASNHDLRMENLRSAVSQINMKFELKIVLIFSSTTSIGPRFVSDWELFARGAPVTTMFYKPFFNVLNIDVLAPRDYLDKISNKSTFDYAFLKERDSFRTIFQFGRPLWASMIAAGNHECVQLARSKLLGACDFKKPSENFNDLKMCTSAAVLASRTPFKIHTTSFLNKIMVADNMATLTNISDDLYDHSITYPHEPVLSEAAASIMRDSEDLASILRIIFMNFGAKPTGDLISQILLLTAFDQASENSRTECQRVSHAITVKMLMEQLIGSDKYEALNLDDELAQGLVFFTRFIKCEDDMKVENVVERFIGRAAAGQFKDAEQRMRLFIPVVLRDNSITYIFIKGSEAAHKPYKVNLIEMSPESETILPMFANSRILPYMSILMSLGCELNQGEIDHHDASSPPESEPRSKPSRHFMFNGLSRKMYPNTPQSVIDAFARGYAFVRSFEK